MPGWSRWVRVGQNRSQGDRWRGAELPGREHDDESRGSGREAGQLGNGWRRSKFLYSHPSSTGKIQSVCVCLCWWRDCCRDWVTWKGIFRRFELKAHKELFGKFLTKLGSKIAVRKYLTLEARQQCRVLGRTLLCPGSAFSVGLTFVVSFNLSEPCLFVQLEMRRRMAAQAILSWSSPHSV